MARASASASRGPSWSATAARSDTCRTRQPARSRSWFHSSPGELPLRILLVDDEPLLTRSFARLLRRLGHDTLEAASGDQALEVLERERVDVVLSDVRMPHGDGASVISRMRARGDQTPLIFLTGYADDADTSLMSLGAEAVLGKPVVLEELTRLLASLPSR